MLQRRNFALWMNQDLMNYFGQIRSYMDQQNKRIEELETMFMTIQEQLNELLEEKNSNKIERIEYHFDQLKIETLEGTLNIGLTPNVPGTIEDFTTGAEDVDTSPAILKAYPNLMPEIRKRSEYFLQHHGHSLIQNVAERHQLSLDRSFYSFILQDIRTQLDDRIYSYLQRITANQVATQGEDKVIKETVSSIKRDIEKGVELFMQNHKEKNQNNDL